MPELAHALINKKEKQLKLINQVVDEVIVKIKSDTDKDNEIQLKKEIAEVEAFKLQNQQ
ncbi:2048_t:CDS:2, partial [Cetraspora pellucida]